MPGGRPLLGGPIFWFITGLLFLTGMLAAFVVMDSFRHKRRDRLAQLPEPWWIYTVPQAFYFVALLITQTPLVVDLVAVIVVFATPFALAQQVVYLLRVVYPKPPAQAEVAEEPDANEPELPAEPEYALEAPDEPTVAPDVPTS